MTKSQGFEIAGHVIAPGTSKNIAIPISALASGMEANLNIRILHGSKPGPVFFISAAIHGDEIIGTAIIREIMPLLDPLELKGTLIIVPTVNVYGFMAQSRYLPDRRDLNRSFPGSSKSSLAGQLANLFLKEVIERSDIGIDIHSAAEHRYNLPQIRYASGSEKLKDLAQIFGAPAMIESPLRPGSMREIAKQRDVDILLMETGEAKRFDRFSIQIGAAGILRIMVAMGMMPDTIVEPSQIMPARSTDTRWLRAPRGGITKRLCKSGDFVSQDDILAVISDVFGEEPEAIIAPMDGLIIGHTTLPVVNQGDALFHIAQVKRLDTAEERVKAITETALDPEQPQYEQPMLDEDELL